MSLESGESFRDRVRAYLPSTVSDRTLGLSVLAVFVYLNIVPIVAILASSFYAEGLTLFGGSFTLSNYAFILGQYELFYNTVVFTLGSAILTTAIGVAIAWVIGRTNAPLRRTFYYTIFFAFFLPPVIWENTWVRLFAKRGVYATLFGVEQIPVRNLPGMIFIQSIRLVAFALILLVPLFASMDTSLEESAYMSGAGIWKTATRITIPTVAPGIMTVFIFVTIISLESFRVPLVIGLPAKIQVLSTAIYEASRVEPVNYGVAMAEGIAIILLALPLLWLYRRFVARSERFETVSGSGFRTNAVDIGRWRYAVSGVVGLYLLFTIVIPTLFMIYISFMPIYLPPHLANPEMFSLANYATVLADPRTWESLGNTLLVAFVATTLTVVVGAGVSWLIQKSEIPFRGTIDYVSFLPIAIPSVALALGLMFIYLQVIPIGIYGTLIIIGLAYVIRGMPGTIRIVDPAIIQMQDDLLESAQLSGASRIRRVVSIVIPTVAQTLAALWSFRFAFLMFELPIVLMLYTSDTWMLSAHLYTLYTNAEGTQAAAIGVLVMFFLAIATVAVHKFGQYIGGGTKSLDV